jgi:hypothetical protein
MADYSKEAVIDVKFDPQLSKKTIFSLSGDAFLSKGRLWCDDNTADIAKLIDNPELFSWRMVVNPDSLTEKFWTTTGIVKSCSATAGTVTMDGFSIYVNGVLDDPIIAGEDNEIVGRATGSFTYTAIEIGSGLHGSVSVFQVFKTVINVNETLNKYEKKEFKEHLNTDNRILSVDGRDGIIGNKYEGDTIGSLVPAVVNTSVVSVRDGSVYANYYNGSTSKLDCGNYDDLTGDKSFIAWIKPYSWGGGGGGRIFENGKAILWINGTGDKLFISRNAAVGAGFSAVDSIKLGLWQLVIGTSTSSGVANLYINGILSGSADQSSGTPAAGITNIIIGDRDADDRTFYGLINQNRIENSILTAQECSQIYTSEKNQYGL